MSTEPIDCPAICPPPGASLPEEAAAEGYPEKWVDEYHTQMYEALEALERSAVLGKALQRLQEESRGKDAPLADIAKAIWLTSSQAAKKAADFLGVEANL